MKAPLRADHKRQISVWPPVHETSRLRTTNRGCRGDRKNAQIKQLFACCRLFLLNQVRTLVAGLKQATEGSLQISGRIRYSLCHRGLSLE
ncbi:hypothetical protein PoB_003267400 [Plakobranchus ocellatus]|uniref:Transposase n=1 Tax=Plakobranchus ocellatus TaxID=259542 RepID=A0AAV4AET5_9GAST|nr:hypothetical protein PoB_003267400 [Plakobranchus ocellatus]